jgi:hypothetical protein
MVAALFVAAIGSLAYLAVVPTLIDNQAILVFLDPEMPVGAYVVAGLIFVLPVIVMIYDGEALDLIAGRVPMTWTQASCLLPFLFVATVIVARFVTTPIYVIRSEAPASLGLSGPLAFDLGLSSTLSFELSNGTTVLLTNRANGGRAASIIVNDSAMQAQLEEISYPRLPYLGGVVSRTAAIAPFSVLELPESIDHFGPNDEPRRNLFVSNGQRDVVLRWVRW